MNNRTKFSIREAAHKVLVAIRVKLNLKPRFTMAEFAQNAGLPVEYLDLPSSLGGWLDPHKAPCFIAVNQNLPTHEQTVFIARQIAVCAHERRCNSLALDRPWKWKVLDAAPDEIKNRIHFMDVEYRTYWFMLLFASGDDYRTFVRKNRKTVFKITFADNVVRYELSKLRVKMWVAELSRKIAVVTLPVS